MLLLQMQRQFLLGFCIKYHSPLCLLKPQLFPGAVQSVQTVVVEFLNIRKYTNKTPCHTPVTASMAIKKVKPLSHVALFERLQ